MKIENFLILRLSSLGDVVLASGVPAALKRAAPGARVIFVTKPPYADLARLATGVDEVWTSDGGVMALARRIGALGNAAVLDLQRNGRTLLIRLLCRGIPFTVVSSASLLRRRAVRNHGLLASIPPRIKSYEDAVGRLLGRAEAPACPPCLQPSVEAEARAGELLSRLAGPEPLVALAPGSLWPTKRWPVERFAEAARALSDRARILVLGNRGEKGLTAQVAQAAGNAALDLGGQTDLPLAAALLSRAKVLLSNDSGLMHLAEAVGTPVVALFGSTVPDLGFRPWRPESRVLGVDLPCRPCHVHGRKSCPLGHFECMRGLAVERALDAVAGLLP